MPDIVGELIKRNLGHLVLDILSHLDAGSVAQAHSVSKTWLSYFGDLNLWRKLCLRKFKHDPKFRKLCQLNGYDTLISDGRDQSSSFKGILLSVDSDFSRWNAPAQTNVSIKTLATCFTCNRNRVIFAKTSGDVHILDLDRGYESILLSDGGHGRVQSLEVTRDHLVLGLGDGRLKMISLEDGTLVYQMKVRDPDYPEVTPGHVSHICHVLRDTHDHVTVMTSGGLLCSWVIDQKRPELVYCTRIEPLQSLIKLGQQHTVFISPSNTDMVRVINTVTGVQKDDIHLDTVSELPVILDMVGEVLMLGYRDRINLWDLRTSGICSKMITRIQFRDYGVTTSLVSMRANETTLAAVVTSGRLCLWSLMDILRAHVGKTSSAGKVGFHAFETQELPYRNRIELTNHKVVFGSERNLGDFCVIGSS